MSRLAAAGMVSFPVTSLFCIDLCDRSMFPHSASTKETAFSTRRVCHKSGSAMHGGQPACQKLRQMRLPRSSQDSQDVNDEVQILTILYILCFRGEPQRCITCNLPPYFIVERFCRKGFPAKEQNVCNRQFVIHMHHNDPPALVIMNSNPPDMSKRVARKAA